MHIQHFALLKMNPDVVNLFSASKWVCYREGPGSAVPFLLYALSLTPASSEVHAASVLLISISFKKIYIDQTIWSIYDHKLSLDSH